MNLVGLDDGRLAALAQSSFGMMRLKLLLRHVDKGLFVFLLLV